MNQFLVWQGFSSVVTEVILALLPLLFVFIIFQFWMLKLSREELRRIFIGLFLALLGLALFLQGVNVGFLPAGSAMGEQFGQLTHKWIVIPIGVLLGFMTIIVEPGVRVLNYEVEKVSGGYIPQRVMLYTLATGVALAIGISMTRILFGIPLLYILIPGYLAVTIMIKFSSSTFTSIAFDSAGVSTGPMTVTFIMALGLGVAAGLEGRDPVLDGFGLVALVALAPVLSVLTLGLIYGGGNSEDEGG